MSEVDKVREAYAKDLSVSGEEYARLIEAADEADRARENEAEKPDYDYRVPAYVIKDPDGLRNLEPDRVVIERTVLITLAIDVDDYCRESDETLTEAMVEKIGQDVNNDAAGIFGYCGWSLELTDKEA